MPLNKDWREFLELVNLVSSKAAFAIRDAAVDGRRSNFRTPLYPKVGLRKPYSIGSNTLSFYMTYIV